MKRLFKRMSFLAAVVTMTGLLLGCGTEDAEVVASTLCDSIDACEGQSASAECSELLTANLENLQDEDSDCYDAFADATMCGGGQCSDAVGDDCSDEEDAVEDNCTSEQLLEVLFGDDDE